MNIKIMIITLFLTVITAVARIIAPFEGWGWVEDHSTDIMVVVAKDPTPYNPKNAFMNATVSDSSITIITILKGTNNMHSARLQTDHELRWGQVYLVFGDFNNGIYKAFEDYRVVPLDIKYRPEMIAGKPLDEQLQILFKLGVDHLNNEIANKEAEKQQLETGLKKP